MKNKISLFLSMSLLVMCCLSSVNFAHSAETNKQAVVAAATQFYVALNSFFTGDLEEMKDVWSHANDVTYMGPVGGLKIGWDQVLKHLEALAAIEIGGVIVPGDMHIIVGQDIAVVINLENGENSDATGKLQKVSIRATNTFRKEEGKWKMIGHHTDMMPWLNND
ncbi:MAG: nuclear transport factor 2 family protein [Candidatus Omnitrophica bacterium]|nr:nuclear transport factor 2 family protein [Candidatus Omnitrophota bacterium]